MLELRRQFSPNLALPVGLEEPLAVTIPHKAGLLAPDLRAHTWA